MTLRQIYVRLRHLPEDSAVAGIIRGGRPLWSIEAHLLDELRVHLTSTKQHPAKPHPQRPKGTAKPAVSRERARKLADARRRARERRRQIEAGELT